MDLKVCGQVLDIYRNNGQSLSIVVRLLELIRVESKFNLIFSFVRPYDSDVFWLSTTGEFCAVEAKPPLVAYTNDATIAFFT